MAKIQIKSEKLTPLRGIFAIMEQFDALLSKIWDCVAKSVVTNTARYSAS